MRRYYVDVKDEIITGHHEEEERQVVRTRSAHFYADES